MKRIYETFKTGIEIGAALVTIYAFIQPDQCLLREDVSNELRFETPDITSSALLGVISYSAPPQKFV